MDAEGNGLANKAGYRRSLFAVIASAGVIGISIGMVMPLAALVLEDHGVPSSLVGLNAAASPLAVLATGAFVPRILDALGVVKAMLLSLFAAVILILALPLEVDPWLWFVLRFLIGMTMAVHWIIGEAWIVSVASREHRGRIVGLYITVMSAGFALGPILLGIVGIEGWLPFLIVALLTALSGLPILFVGKAEPKFPPRAKGGFLSALRAAPLVLAAAALAGFTDTTLVSLFPIYGLRLGLDQSFVVWALAVALMGNVALQVPIGWLGDHFDKRRLLIACGAVILVAPLLLPSLFGSSVLQWPLLIIWGGASFGIYTLALTIIGERFDNASLAAANAAMVALYEAGSVVGPLVGGVALDVVGESGFPATLAGAAGLFLLLVATRIGTQRRPPPGREA